MDEITFVKQQTVFNLLIEVNDDLVNRFFDIESDELMDEKIEVLTALKNGVAIKDIPKFYDILELMPKDSHWD